MKKVLVALAFLTLTVSSAWGAALEGTVTKLAVLENGDVEVTINSFAGKRIRNANINKKEMYAMLLTAQTAGKNIKITHTDGFIKTTAIVPAAL